MPTEIDPHVAMLRHTLATVAYRGGKTLRGAPAGFAGFRVAGSTRTPGEILAHIGDLFDWALAMAQGRHEWHSSTPIPWDDEVKRFHRTLGAFDEYLASGLPVSCPVEKLFQAPVADALTHIGQIALLRRAAGTPIRGENYFKAEITAGRLGPDQAASRVEFD